MVEPFSFLAEKISDKDAFEKSLAYKYFFLINGICFSRSILVAIGISTPCL